MTLKTIVDAYGPDGKILWTARTRRDLEKKLGRPAFSRNDNPRCWSVTDPSGCHSLVDVDEVSSGDWKTTLLRFRLERVGTGNSKQRRRQRRTKVVR
jgi:hypothetical protein